MATWPWTVEGVAAVVGATWAYQLRGALGVEGTGALMGVALVLVLLARWRADRHWAPLHWLNVVVVGVVGASLAGDLVERGAVPLTVSASILTLALGCVYFIWWIRELTRSAREVRSPGNQLCYWLVVLLSFAAGTAVTDLLREQAGLGDWSTALLVGVVILAVAATRYGLGASTTTCFWVTYLLTRPLGAAVGHAAIRARGGGGLGLSPLWIDTVLVALVLACVTFLAMTRRDSSSTVVVIDLTVDRQGERSTDRSSDGALRRG